MRFLSTQLTEVSLHDSEISGLSWSADGNDIAIELVWLLPVKLRPASGDPTLGARLTCIYASEIVINMEFGRYMGRPTIYSNVFEQLPNGRWRVEIRMLENPNGAIRLECNDLRFESTE